MNSLTPADLILCIVVISYWAVLWMIAKSQSRAPSMRLVILPLFFIILGMTINRRYPMVGTYAVTIVHLALLVPLWRIANSKQ